LNPVNPSPEQLLPYDYQFAAYNALREGIKAGHKRQMLVSPTGSGKTVLAMIFAEAALRRKSPTVFVADRTVLIDQTGRTAYKYGLPFGVIQGRNHPWFAPEELFQIATAQTLAKRPQWPEAKLILIDEAHAVYDSWRERIMRDDVAVIGLSATPFTDGLGKIFTNLVSAATMHQLVGLGKLVPLRVKSCKPIDMTDAPTDKQGEWTKQGVEERGLQIVGDVVSEWMRYADNRKTIVFGPTIEYCEALCQQFVNAGIEAATYTSDTASDQRTAILAEYAKSDTNLRVLLSVSALAKGFNQVDVSCVVDCRPLRKSLSEFVQMIGRGLRISPATGKTDCLLLDHSGNLARFGDDFERFYFHGVKTLDEGERLDRVVRKEPDDYEPKGCPRCSYKPFCKTCMSCGFELPARDQIEIVAGTMEDVEINGQGVTMDRRDVWNELVAYTSTSKSKNPEGWARALFKEIVGEWPSRQWPFEQVEGVTVSSALRGRITQKAIAYRANAAKAKKAAKRELDPA